MKSEHTPGAPEEKRILSELDAMIRLHSLSALALTGNDLSKISAGIVDVAIELTGADFADIQLVDPSSSSLRVSARRGFPAGVQAVQSTPLISRSGKSIGVLSTDYKKPHTPDERTLRLLDVLARQAADIIEHVQTIAALSESESRYRTLAELATDGIFVTDSEGRYVGVNRAGCEMLGYTRDELLTLHIPDVIPPDELPKLPAQYARLATGQEARNEWRFKRKDGSVFIGELVARQFPDGLFHGIVRDVTERSRLRQAQREQEQQLLLALRASGAGAWARDARTGRVDWDDRFREIHGFAATERAAFDTWLNHVHEDDRREVLELLDNIESMKQDTFDMTFRIVRPDGTVSWIESLGQAERDGEGQVIRLSGLEMDVTERRRAEEALQARRADERDRALREQAGEALRRSHAELEQRTLQLRRLASQLTLTEQNAREHLARTLHDGLQQLLFTASMKLEQTAKASHDDQAGLLQGVRTDIKEAMDAARSLSVDLFPRVLHLGGLPAALPWLAKRAQEQYGVLVNVIADPRANPTAGEARILLFEAIRELLFNAVKHANVDRVDVNLAVTADDTIQIDVIDAGVGFDPATAFDGNQQPIGLGLFSIRERIGLFGGQLDIKSAPGEGARFRLTLPRTDPSRLTADAAADAPRHDSGWQERVAYDTASGTPKALRIVIADDHAVIRTGLRGLFSSRPPLQVVGEAANGVEAISQAMALRPDVIVMDVSMPQMNGIDATREIHAALPHIQIVGLSTYADENTERVMREAGAVAYFTKNEGTDRLINCLLSLLPHAKAASVN